MSDNDTPELVYAVERHDDGYHGPHKYEVAVSLEDALDIAEDMREKHRGEKWEMRTRDAENGHITFHPVGSPGWVTLKMTPLY